MDPKKLFNDERLNGKCVYCGDIPDTRDHVPSKVLLDQPYPIGLPVVPCCKACNNGFSADEVYLACILECVIHGTTITEKLTRPKIKRILQEKPQLQAKIELCKNSNKNPITWDPDKQKIRNTILKLARGHAAYELSEPQTGEPEFIAITPRSLMSDSEIEEFENFRDHELWPEIGSRSFINTIISNKSVSIESGWNVIQTSRYRYMVNYEEGTSVKIVISEYLYCQITF